MDKMVYNALDMPYADNIKMSEWNEFMAPLHDVKLEEWQYLWKTIVDSMYYVLLHGCEKDIQTEDTIDA